MANISFIEYLKPYAQAMESKYGIDWRIITAQAILESGWGEVNRQWNLWGMKYEGPAGRDVEGYALFNDQWEAIEAYVYNVRKNHPTAWEVRNNPELFFKEIQNSQSPNAGAWAEDSKYTNKLIQLFNSYLSDETTAIDPNQPPEESPNTAPIYFPQTSSKVEAKKKDSEGAKISEQRYYVKLHHVNDNEEPTRALTIKITPDSQFIINREKLKRSEDEKTVEVEESCSLSLIEDGLLIDLHNNNSLKDNPQKLTDQIQLRNDYIGIYRNKEGKKTKTEAILITDEVIQLEVDNEDKKSRIEVQPNKILAKDGDTSYVRIEKDIIQGKNKTGSQVYVNDDLIVAQNKTGTKSYIRGDYLELKNSGCSIKLSGNTVTITAANIIINGSSLVDIISDSLIRETAGTVDINGGATVDINGGATVDIDGGVITLN